MNHDPQGSVATGLKEYVRQVAVHTGEDAWGFDYDVETYPAMATVYVRSHLPTLPNQQLLLTWDELSGWALRVTLDDAESTALAYLGRDLLPPPATAAAFLRDGREGRNPGSLLAPHFRGLADNEDLESRLAQFV